MPLVRKISKCLAALVLFAGLTVAAAAIRARFLPQVDVPVLLYERVERMSAAQSAGKYTVGDDLFYAQLRDLSRRGYTTVTPDRLLAYKRWGWPLPKKPLLITFDYAGKDLPAIAGQYLDDQDFTAVVLLSTSYINNEALKRRQILEGVEMMTWEEVRHANESGLFSFGGHTRSHADLTLSEDPFSDIRASRSDIKKNLEIRTGVFSYPKGKHTPEIEKAAKHAKINFAMTYGNTVAKIGHKTNMLAIPRIRVVGGMHGFSIVATESRSETRFGAVKIRHTSGPSFSAHATVRYGDDPRPVAQTQIADFSEANSAELALPYPANGNAAAMFPITVEIRDSTGVLLYHSVMIHKNGVVRGAIVNMDGEFNLEELNIE